jgi:hypothetical protein
MSRAWAITLCSHDCGLQHILSLPHSLCMGAWAQNVAQQMSSKGRGHVLDQHTQQLVPCACSLSPLNEPHNTTDSHVPVSAAAAAVAAQAMCDQGTQMTPVAGGPPPEQEAGN